MTPDDIHRRLTRASLRSTQALQSVQDTYDALQVAEKRLSTSKEARTIAQETAQAVQTLAHSHVASVVSRCLEAVFSGDYEFRLEFVRHANRTECDLSFLQNGEPVDPLTGVPGGVVDVTAFALRLACLMLQHPPGRRLLVMDEPFKGVHGTQYRKRVACLLTTLAEELGFQFLIVTGIPEYRVGDVIDL